MTSIAHVTVSYTSQYPDPIAFEEGDLVTLTGRTDNWNGHTWLWAVASKDGREGWIPDSIIDAKQGAEQRASFDYNAQELSCHEGECLTIVDATHGWCWCENQDGRKGWVPEETQYQVSGLGLESILCQRGAQLRKRNQQDHTKPCPPTI